MAASSSSVSRPQVIVPSASRDTTRPLRPSLRCSTTGQPTGGTTAPPGSTRRPERRGGGVGGGARGAGHARWVPAPPCPPPPRGEPPVGLIVARGPGLLPGPNPFPPDPSTASPPPV